MRALGIYKTETPLHMGAGTELGLVDMPIQREKHTGFPKIEASGLKGVYRDRCEHKKWFGTGEGEEEAEGSAGKLLFTDGRLLFLPVKTARGIFAWITCPYVLERFLRETQELENELNDLLKKLPESKDEKEEESQKGVYTQFKNKFHEFYKDIGLEDFEVIYLGKEKSKCIFDEKTKNKIKSEKIIIEEFSFSIKNKEVLFPYQLLNLEAEENMKKDFFLVNDEIFSYFCEMATEVITRIRIGENGVVEDGALFTEEFLPEESYLYNIIADMEFVEQKERVLKDFAKKMNEKKMIQLGGDSTLGKGITSFHIYYGEEGK